MKAIPAHVKALIVIGLLFIGANIARAGDTCYLQTITYKNYSNDGLFCIEGYTFVKGYRELTQVFETIEFTVEGSKAYETVPMKCKCK